MQRVITYDATGTKRINAVVRRYFGCGKCTCHYLREMGWPATAVKRHDCCEITHGTAYEGVAR